MPVEFGILGPLEVRADGRVLPLGSPRQRALLGLLLLHANEAVSRDRLIEELWGEAAPATVESALHVYLSRLRTLFASTGDGGVLVREAHGYELRIDANQVDANRFERFFGEGSEALAAGKAELAADRLRQALALWRGPALADLQSVRFAIAAGARLAERRVSALEERLAADLALGRHRQLIGELETLVAEHPYRERLRAQKMLALYRSGRQAEALRVYQEARRTLSEELGLEPSQELKELEQAILRQDPALIPEPPTTGPTEPELSPPLLTAAPPPNEERKVLTVLIADLVGFTAEGGSRDVEDVRAILDRYWAALRAEIERHGGTVEKFVGDAVMALFGAPRTHEDDPERAVRAALAIRDWAVAEDQLDVHIGVATGEALVRLGARPLAGEGMVAGEVVNIAARLGAAAPPNTILVGDRTYQATKHVIEYQKQRSIQGRADATLVWEPLQALSRFGVDPLHRALTPLVGRERELELLRSTLARAREEREPQLVTLVGVPGIGKSRLVYELARTVDADPSVIITWRQGRSLPYGDGITFSALAEIVKAHAGMLATDSAEQAEQKLTRAVRTIVGSEHEAEWFERHLRPLAGLAAHGQAAGDNRIEAFAAWLRFFELLADSRPLVLVFEDLHWADESFLEFVDYLVDRASGVALLVVCTTRPELLARRPGWGGGKTNALTISLAPLSDDDTARLVSGLAPEAELSAETQEAVLARAGGNPLYAEHYARLLEKRIATELELPGTLEGLIAARLDLLEPEQKSLLQNAAVVGKTFWLGAIEAASGAERDEAAATLHSLARMGFVRRERTSSIEGDDEYAFLHVLVQEAAYDQIPRAPRSEKHRHAAEWLASHGRFEDHAEMLAHHYRQALALGRAVESETASLEEPARRALRDAGDRAMALNAYAAALRFYDEALELWPAADADRARLLFRRAKALFLAVDAWRIDLFAAAHDELVAHGDPETAAEAKVWEAIVLVNVGEQNEAVERASSAAALLEDAPTNPTKAYVVANWARALMLARRYPEAMEVARRALAMADELGLGDIRASALSTIGSTRMGLVDLGGIEDLEESVRQAREHGSPHDLGRAYNNLAVLSMMTGRIERASELFAAHLDHQERFGISQWFAEAGVVYGAFWTGRWDDATRRLDKLISADSPGPRAPRWPELCSIRARIRLARDDLTGAAEDCAETLAHLGEELNPGSRVEYQCACAQVAVAEGRATEAADLVAQTLKLGWKPPYGISGGPVELAFLVERLGHSVQPIVEASQLYPDLPWLRAAAAVARGEFLDAAEQLVALRCPPLESHARLRAAEQLAAEGGHTEADEQLEKALAFWRSVGATKYVREAETLLAATA